MKRLKTLLNQYVVPVQAGDGEELDGESLKLELETLRDAHQRTFYLCAGMVITAFIASIVVVILLMNDPSKIAALFGATGVTTAGMITLMVKIWKEKVAIDLTLALVGSLQPEAYGSFLAIIAKKF